VFNPGLAGWVQTSRDDNGMERGAYADFLDEAAALLKAPELRGASALFRDSSAAWNALVEIALPDDAPSLRETRALKRERHVAYVDRGGASLPDLARIEARLREIETVCATTPPVSEARAAAIFEGMRAQVLRIRDIEFEAIKTIRSAL
jgi:hypothetical protein